MLFSTSWTRIWTHIDLIYMHNIFDLVWVLYNLQQGDWEAPALQAPTCFKTRWNLQRATALPKIKTCIIWTTQSQLQVGVGNSATSPPETQAEALESLKVLEKTSTFSAPWDFRMSALTFSAVGLENLPFATLHFQFHHLPKGIRWTHSLVNNFSHWV